MVGYDIHGLILINLFSFLLSLAATLARHPRATMTSTYEWVMSHMNESWPSHVKYGWVSPIAPRHPCASVTTNVLRIIYSLRSLSLSLFLLIFSLSHSFSLSCTRTGRRTNGMKIICCDRSLSILLQSFPTSLSLCLSLLHTHAPMWWGSFTNAGFSLSLFLALSHTHSLSHHQVHTHWRRMG